MPFLTLNGITVAVANGSVSMSYEDVGGATERSPAGDLVGGPLVRKREWQMSTTPIPAAEERAWTGLIEGAGHTLSFNTSTYSSRGRGPSALGGSVLLAGSAKYGAAALRVGSGDAIQYALSLSTWTVMLWRLESGTWRHYVVTSDGHKWKGGVRNDATTTSTFLAVSSGTLQVGDFGGSTGIRDFDDVVALPYVVPDAWVPSLYTQHAASAWSSLPRVTAAGTFCSSTLSVRGKVTGAKALTYTSGGVRTSGYLLDFTLQEV